MNKIAIEVNIADPDDMIKPALGINIAIELEFIVEPDPTKISVDFNKTFFSFKLRHLFLNYSFSTLSDFKIRS